MDYTYKFRLLPTTHQREQLDWVRDTVRQLYNHTLHRYNRIPESTGTVQQRVTRIRDEIPTLKDWWTELTTIYSTILQHAVEQVATNIENLGKLKAAGYNVGSLNWKAPHEYRSFTYRQRGFELDTNSGPENRGNLVLKKAGGETLHVPVRLHRSLPDTANVKHVTVKKAKTGAWYACLNAEQSTPDKPDTDDIDTTDTVGIDLGITSFIHDSDGRIINRLDLSTDRERLEREQRSLSRKQYGSNNWEQQRQCVAKVHKRMRNKKEDFKHKLAAFYTSEYDAVFVEDLNVTSMLEGERDSRNIHEVGWRDFITILKHHGEKRGCHVVEVQPAGTTKECASCGVESDKPLWVREHSCPSCGFELDRDYNAALNVWQRGLDKLGVGYSEGTPVETAIPVDEQCVSAKRVIETGSPTLKERAASAASE